MVSSGGASYGMNARLPATDWRVRDRAERTWDDLPSAERHVTLLALSSDRVTIRAVVFVGFVFVMLLASIGSAVAIRLEQERVQQS